MNILDRIVGLGEKAVDRAIDKEFGPAPNDGLARTGVRPEYIADQASVGVQSPAGFHGTSNPATSSAIAIGGVQFSKPVLYTTGIFLAGVIAVRALG